MHRFLRWALFLAVALLAALPARATTYSAAHVNTGADITSSGSSYTITSTTAGNSLVVFFNMRTSASDTITSVTDSGGDTFRRAARATNATGARAQEIWYANSIHAAQTAITVNYTTSGNTVTVFGIEYHSTRGPIFFDAGAGSTNASASSGTWPGTQISGHGNDFVVTYWAANGSVLTGVNSPFANRGSDNHGNPVEDTIAADPSGVVPNTNFGPTFTTSGTDATVNNCTAAFRDVSTQPRHR